jgi:hypothetical protein
MLIEESSAYKNYFFTYTTNIKSMRQFIIVVAIVAMASCTTAKLPVPEDFSIQSTKMQVQGLNGWMINQQLTFGNYQTSKIKRGWDFQSSLQYTKFSISPEEAILKVFTIDTDHKRLKQKNKFQYTIEGENAIAEVYATEEFTEKQLVYKSNNPWIGSASKTKNYKYAFTAAIVPLTTKNAAAWSLVLINTYDINKDTNREIFGRPDVQEEGYATNGTESIAIAPLRVDKVAGKDGKETKVLGGNLLGGYQLSIDNKPIAMIDILDNSIRISNALEPARKIVVSSIASAILLKRMQDVEKDKPDL